MGHMMPLPMTHLPMTHIGHCGIARPPHDAQGARLEPAARRARRLTADTACQDARAQAMPSRSHGHSVELQTSLACNRCCNRQEAHMRIPKIIVAGLLGLLALGTAA